MFVVPDPAFNTLNDMTILLEDDLVHFGHEMTSEQRERGWRLVETMCQRMLLIVAGKGNARFGDTRL
jgi:hypothetical protein